MFKQFKELFEIPLRNGLTKPKAVRGSGTKMINMGELFANPRIRCIDMDRVELSTIEKNNSLLKYEDLLFARQSLVLSGAGKCSIFLGDIEDVCFESHLIRCRLKSELADPHYYFYFFRSRMGRAIIETIVEQGAGASGIRGSDLSGLLVPWIDLSIQRQVSTTLRLLDEKIENNNRINYHLEQIAQMIFKSWFVDFEPWGGVMPSDWHLHKLGDFFPVKTGKMNANVSSNTGKYPFFSCSRDIAWTDQYSFDGKAILVAGNGEFNVKWYNGKFEAYQRTYVLMPYDSSLLALLYYVTKDGLDKITSNARGSVIRFITKGNIENHTFYAPSNIQELKITGLFESINKQIEKNINETLKLSEIRDTLLPRLLSGELAVSDLPDVS